MSLNTNNYSAGGSGADLGRAKVGPHIALLSGVIDVGIQDGGTWKGQAKPPGQRLLMIFELTDDTVEIGGVVHNRMYTTKVWAKSGAKAGLTHLVRALDPTGATSGDLTAMIGMPCILSLIDKPGTGEYQGQIFSNLDSSMQVMPGTVVPALTHEPIIFDTATPDMGMYDKMLPWMHKTITGALNYTGSELEKVIAAHESQVAATAPVAATQPAATQPVAQVPVAQVPVAQVPVAAPQVPVAQVPVAAPPPLVNPAPVAAPALPAAPPGFKYDPATNSFVPSE